MNGFTEQEKQEIEEALNTARLKAIQDGKPADEVTKLADQATEAKKKEILARSKSEPQPQVDKKAQHKTEAEAKRKADEENERKTEERRKVEETKRKNKNTMFIIIAIIVLIAFVLWWAKSCEPTPVKESKISTDSTIIDSSRTPTNLGTINIVTQHIIDSIAAMQPMNLWNLIDQLDGQKKVWDAQVNAVQGVTGKLHQKAMALTGGTVGSLQNVWGQINQMSQQPSITLSPTPEILNEISSNVKEIKKGLKEHRAGARASHQQAAEQRNRIENKIYDLDTKITLARTELKRAKEDLETALNSGKASSSDIDNKMTNLQLRLEGLERLQKHQQVNK